jgi:hypothetical protein
VKFVLEKGDERFRLLQSVFAKVSEKLSRINAIYMKGSTFLCEIE